MARVCQRAHGGQTDVLGHVHQEQKWSWERCPGIGFFSRGDREIGVLRNVEPPTRPRLECLRETGLILRCDRKVGNPFQTKQGSRPSCPDQEGRKGSEEGVPENLSVPLEGDRDFGELCGSHQGCQVPFRPPIFAAVASPIEFVPQSIQGSIPTPSGNTTMHSVHISQRVCVNFFSSSSCM